MFDKKCEKWSTNKVNASIGAYQRGFFPLYCFISPCSALGWKLWGGADHNAVYLAACIPLFCLCVLCESVDYYLTSVSVFSGHFHSCWLSWWCTFEMLKVSNFQHFPRTYVWCALFGLWALNELHDLNVP